MRRRDDRSNVFLEKVTGENTGGDCHADPVVVQERAKTIARIALPMAAQKTIASKVMGMNAGHAAWGLPPKFIGQSRTIT